MRGSWLNGALLALLSVGCAAFSPSSGQEGTMIPAKVEALGRTVTGPDGAVTVGWAGSGLGLSLTGTRAVMTATDSGRNVFDVLIDGERVGSFRTREGSQDYVLWEADTPQSVQIEVRRQTESFDGGLTLIEGVTVDGSLNDYPEPGRRILFLGDSITAGFGVGGADETCAYDVETNDAQRAYSVRTARAFGADYHLVAISGRGAVLNYGNDPRPNMLTHLSLALPDEPTAWDHSAWTPDVVVVNLGTNDFSQASPDQTFTANYTGILYQLSAHYPGTPVVAMTGPFASPEGNAAIRAGVAEAATRAREKGVTVREVTVDIAKEGHVFGCSYHPGPDSTKVMAKGLIPAVAEVTGWDVVQPVE